MCSLISNYEYTRKYAKMYQNNKKAPLNCDRSNAIAVIFNGNDLVYNVPGLDERLGWIQIGEGWV